MGTWSVRLADGTGSATFQVNAASSGLYTVTPLNGPHGSITPNTALTKAGGESQTFIAAPQDSTYTVDSWYLDGSAVPITGNRFTLADIGAAHTVYVTFKPVTTTAQTGSLTVTLQPAGAISAGAQWQADGGNYRNSGDIVTDLTPGQHQITFKSISGYTTPANETVTVNASAQTTTNATYNAVAPTTYTLTLSAVNGSISPSPTASGNVYNSGSVVQLTAYANTGYHFTGWSGAATGTANPTTITMSANETVTANFASGDPSLATVTVTIKPDAAANAGVTWSVTGDSQLRAGGTSLSEAVGSGYTAYLPVTLNLVAGWLGTNGTTSFYIPITAGTVTNVTLTCVPNNTPGLLTVTLSPPDAVNAGAHWHVNGGTYGQGASASLTPGNYTVTFDAVSGWTAPASQPVTMQPSQTIALSGNYAPPLGQPAIISISPPIGPNVGGTFMTINDANFSATTNVLVGGKPASNISVFSATQITCLTPSSTTNGSVPVVVQTTGGSATNSNGFAYGVAYGSNIDFVSSVGGSCFGATVQGNYAYVGEGRNFVVLNVSSPSSPSKVGQVTLPGLVRGIALLPPSYQYAYVANEEGGIQVVDISNPLSPALRGSFTTTNYTWIDGITIYGGRAYAASENDGLQIFDLSTPTMPTLLSSTNVGGGEAVLVKASSQGVFAYISTGGSLYVVDVSNPLSPIARGHASMGSGGVYSIAISGNYVFGAALWDYAIHAVDVSNPDSPVDSMPSAGGYGTCFPYSLAVANNNLYVASDLPNGGFLVFSISGNTLTKIGQVLNYSFYGYNMIVSGSYAYIASGKGGVSIANVSNPYSPTIAATFTDSGSYGQYNAVAASGNTLCADLSGSMFGDLKVFDTSQPNSPSLVGQLTGITENMQVLSQNGIAYLIGNGYDTNQLSARLINITTPSSPQLVYTVPDTVIYNYKLALAGTMLYGAGENPSRNAPRFAAIDVSNPNSPIVRSTHDYALPNAYGWSVAVNGNRAALGVIGATNLLCILDISNVSAPVEKGSLFTTNGPIDIRISPEGNYAYFITTEIPAFLHVANISNASNPTIATNIPLDISQARCVELQGSELFVGTYRGLYVYDISSPTTPILKRTYSLTGMNKISVPTDSSHAGYIYVANADEGITTLREQDIQAPDVYITDPIFGSTWTSPTSTTELGGGSDDNVGVTAITWANNRGGSGQVSPPFDPSWYVPSIALYPGTNILTVTAFDAAGNSGTDSLAVIYQTANQNQTITFPTIANHTFGDEPITLEAAASSGLPVNFSVISGPAILTSSNILTLTGAGAVTVQGNQPGNSLYNPAPSTNVSFTVSRANQSISFAPIPAKSAGDAPFTLAATTSSGLPAYFSVLSGPATLDTNNNLTLLAAGSVTVLAWQPGNSNYNAAATMQQSFNVSKIPQTITFGTLSPQKQGDAPFPLNATADSGLLVSFSISGPATLSGNILTLTGHGTVTVTASQPGNSSYAASTPVVQSFAVAPPDNTLVGLGFQNRSFQMAFYGMTGSNYMVQASSNLLDWQPFTNFIITVSPYNFTDPSATNFDKRFYRATLP